MFAALKKLFPEPPPAAVNATYIALVAASRNPYFYTTAQVPDTIDGRFELIVLHLFALQHRLQSTHQETFARYLSEAFFDDLDRSLRELGVFDTGIGKRIKRMGKAYHGRLQTYHAAFDDDILLRAALSRNLYGTIAEGDIALLDLMANYLRRCIQHLHDTDIAVILEGRYAWPTPAQS